MLIKHVSDEVWMKYVMAVTDKDVFRDHICEEHEYISFVTFEDKDKEKIFDLLLKQFAKENPEYSEDDGILKWFYASAVDENGILYIVDYGKRCFLEYGTVSGKVFRKAILLQNAKRKKSADIAKAIRQRFAENTIERRMSFIPGYGKFVYYDVANGIEMPFRFRECKGKGKKPVLIYLHGAGAVGNDNFKQLAEFMTVGSGVKEDSFVLLPQSDEFTLNNLSTIKVFTSAVRGVVEKLAETYPIDKDRIYVTGISFGGACTWYSVYDNPGFYAAAIPLMGYFPEVDSDNFDPSAFEGANIWAGHAKDDKVVPSDSDEKTCERLKDVCDIRLSLYEKGGHRMMREFYRREKWQEWLFCQRRQRR